MSKFSLTEEFSAGLPGVDIFLNHPEQSPLAGYLMRRMIEFSLGCDWSSWEQVHVSSIGKNAATSWEADLAGHLFLLMPVPLLERPVHFRFRFPEAGESGGTESNTLAARVDW